MTVNVSERPRAVHGGERPVRSRDPGWRIVAEQECRDLWVSGRGPVLVFAFSVLLSVMTYLAGTNQVLNFLEQREAVNLTLQVAVAVGVLVTLVVSADAISGERERGTLESLLLTPVSRRAIVMGKLVAALSLWLATFLVSVPYVWVLGRGVSIVGPAILLGLLVGTLLAVALSALGLLISALSSSNKVSLAVCFFLLLALFAPTQLPGGGPKGWFGDMLVRLNPVGAALRYLTAVVVNGHDWTRDLSYLVSPLVTAVLAGGALVIAGSRIVRLHGGVSGE
ncbi:ABC transporter permease subunit [Micromonospora sp. NPDC049679]|uniref:ABC transporter permease n=1 Tax=Micromonospora sp. NPDC049679 TaxID=3155920 RepID=UPI0033E7F566